MRLILASTSPARLAVLQNAGIEPIVRPSQVDEDAVLASNGPLTPAETVLTLARAKALAVADSLGDAGGSGNSAILAPQNGAGAAELKGMQTALDGLVLGGDSMFEVDGKIYGKPGSPEIARERWEMQRGKTGTLWSGHWLVDRTNGATGEGVGAVKSAEVTFVDDLSDAEIEAYIASGEPLWVAGAFTIDSLGGAFIERISGDPSTVIGISLPVIRSLTKQLGYEWTSLWNRNGAAAITS